MTLSSIPKRYVRAAAVILLIVLGTITALRAAGYDGWDVSAAEAAAQTRTGNWTTIWQTMNDLGSTVVIGGVALLSAACWGLLRKWKIACAFIGIVLGAYLLQMALKSVFGWDRPQEAWGIEYDGYGYPSGNATIAAALYGWWLLLGILEVRMRAAKLIICSLAVLLIAATGWSRIYFSVHFLSDVAAGYCVGGICALLAALICSWRRPL